MNKDLRKPIFFTIVAVLIITLGFVLYSFFDRFSITITTVEGSEIYVASNSTSGFEKIGTTEATYNTKQLEPVFIEVRNGESRTRRTIYPETQSGQTLFVNIYPKSDVKQLYDSPIYDTYEDKKTIYGISGNTNSIFSASKKGSEPPRLSFISMPFLSNIYWKNARNFVYEDFTGGIGIFQNNENLGYSYFGTSASNNWDSGEGFAPRIRSVSEFPGKPLVLLSDSGIFKSNNLGIELVFVAPSTFNEHSRISSDSNNIYYFVEDIDAAFVSETEDSIAENDPESLEASLKFKVYNYNGNEKFTAIVPDYDQISGVGFIDKNSEYFISSRSQYGVISADGVIENTITYSTIIESYVTDEGAIIFANDGIWQLDTETNDIFLLSIYPENTPFVKNSAKFTNDLEEIVFSTRLGGAYLIKPSSQ